MPLAVLSLSEAIGLSTFIVMSLVALGSGAAWMLGRLDRRFEQLQNIILSRISEVVEDTDKLKAITADLKGDIGKIKKTCSIMHGVEDSNDPSVPIVQERRFHPRHGEA